MAPVAEAPPIVEEEETIDTATEPSDPDGQEVDKIWISFKGRVGLDRTKADDVALFNRLRLGKELELRVAGKGVAVGTKKTTSRGGDLDAVVGERVLEIDTVYVLSPEELVA